jgi:hypothetical protein
MEDKRQSVNNSSVNLMLDKPANIAIQAVSSKGL